VCVVPFTLKVSLAMGGFYTLGLMRLRRRADGSTMRLVVFLLVTTALLRGETPATVPAPAGATPANSTPANSAPRTAERPRPVTLSDAKRKRGKYKTPKPHTARRAKDANKRVGGPKQAHPVWGKPKGK